MLPATSCHVLHAKLPEPSNKLPRLESLSIPAFQQHVGRKDQRFPWSLINNVWECNYRCLYAAAAAMCSYWKCLLNLFPRTLEKISELTEIYEVYPCLYNVKDSSYYDRDKKKMLFLK